MIVSVVKFVALKIAHSFNTTYSPVNLIGINLDPECKRALIIEELRPKLEQEP